MTSLSAQRSYGVGRSSPITPALELSQITAYLALLGQGVVNQLFAACLGFLHAQTVCILRQPRLPYFVRANYEGSEFEDEAFI